MHSVKIRTTCLFGTPLERGMHTESSSVGREAQVGNEYLLIVAHPD
jgi:hypothetical protein